MEQLYRDQFAHYINTTPGETENQTKTHCEAKENSHSLTQNQRQTKDNRIIHETLEQRDHEIQEAQDNGNQKDIYTPS